MASEMRDGILTEESYRNVARCPPMTLNVSVVSCVGRSPYMYAKKARARRPHGRPHGRTPTSHKTPTQNSRPLCRYRSNRIVSSTWRRAAPQLHFHCSIQEVRTSVGSVAAPRWSLDARRRLRRCAAPSSALVAARRPACRLRVDRYSATGSFVFV